MFNSQIAPWMKGVEVPSVASKILFGKVDKAHLEKVRTVAQNYFDAVLADEKLSSSELIYAYLSPSPEHLKQVEIQRKKSKFSFSTFFKGYDVLHSTVLGVVTFKKIEKSHVTY